MSPPAARNILSLVLLALLVIATLLNAFVVVHLGNHLSSETEWGTYTWNGTDYPISLPLDVTTFPYSYTEHVDHWGLSQDSMAIAAWDALLPAGLGFVWLGPEKRRFSIAMFHQIHCLQTLRDALGTGGSASPHEAHCLNFLMQLMLCAADVTLEPEAFPAVLQEGVPKTTPFEATHTCRDWTAIYKHVEELYWE